MIRFVYLLLVLVVGVFTQEWYGIGTNPGPQVVATKGEPWPAPKEFTKSDEYYVIRPSIFQFEITDNTCNILQEAVTRYSRVLLDHEVMSLDTIVTGPIYEQDLVHHGKFAGNLDKLQVSLTQPCETLPHLNMDEAYTLTEAALSSASIWGILRGLETFTQLVHPDDNATALVVPAVKINDSPRFSHRGLMIDTSRHYEPVSALLSILDGMEANKLNVFHWHIVDDQSFPYESITFPDMSIKGAYTPNRHVYTQVDIKNIIEYATLRGIRVIPEFDTPGHTRSWGKSKLSLLTACYQNGEPDGSYGPFDPTKQELFDFMNTFLKEVTGVFPDDHFHLGGDEVVFSCWNSNPDVAKFMEEKNLTAHGLQEYYIQQIVDMTAALKETSIVWQEVFDDGAKLPSDVIVHIWKGGQENELAAVTSSGLQALLSSCWYLDYLVSGGDWHKYYDCEPYNFEGTDEQKKLVVGGEACMWAEVVDVINLSSRVWPRASAVAERLWSPQSVTDKDAASQRLEEHYCRMNRRNIRTQPPSGAGFCPDANYK